MANRRSNSPPHKRCLGCSYILDHLPENRCPECGRAFDPDDPRTFTNANPSFWTRFDTGLLPLACIGSLLLCAPLLLMVVASVRRELNTVAFVESPIFFFSICGFPVGFAIVCMVALAVSRACRQGRRSRSLTTAGWVAAGSLTVFLLFMILGSLIKWIANRW